MKYLLVLTLLLSTAFAQERPSVRMAKEALKSLKDMPDYCSELTGTEKAYCSKKLADARKDQIDRMVELLAQDHKTASFDKIKADIQEEKLVAKYKKALDSYGVSYLPTDDSSALYDKIKAHEKQMRIDDLRNKIDACGGSYTMSDTEEALVNILWDCMNPPSSGSGSGS